MSRSTRLLALAVGRRCLPRQSKARSYHAIWKQTRRSKLPKQDLTLLVRLEIGAMLFAPMNIDTVIVDLEAMQLVMVRRTQVSAKADVRQLELGTWPDGTTMETSAEMAQWIAEQNRANAVRATSATNATGNARGPHRG